MYSEALEASKAAARRNEYEEAARQMEAYARAFPGGRHFHAAEQRAVSLRSMLQSVDDLDRAAKEDINAGRFDAAIGKWKRAVLTDPTRNDLRRKIRQAQAELAEPPDGEDEETQDIPFEEVEDATPPTPSALSRWLADPARRARLKVSLALAGVAVAAAGALWGWLWLDNAGCLSRAQELAACGEPEAAIEAYQRAREMPFLPAIPPMPAEWGSAATQKKEALAAATPAQEARKAAEDAEASVFAPERWSRAEGIAEGARAAWARHGFAEARKAWEEAATEFRACRTEALSRADAIREALKSLDTARAACEEAGAPALASAQWTSATGLTQSARAAWDRRAVAEARTNATAARAAFDACLKEAQNVVQERKATVRVRDECAALCSAAAKVDGKRFCAAAWETGEQRRREGEAALEKNAFTAARMAFDAAKTAYEECRTQSVVTREAQTAAAAARETAQAARTAAATARQDAPKGFAAAERAFDEAAKKFDAGDYARATTQWEASRSQFAALPALSAARGRALASQAEAQRNRALAQRQDARTNAPGRWQSAEDKLRQAGEQIADEQFDAAARSAREAIQEYTASIDEGRRKGAERETAKQAEKAASDARTKAVQCKCEEYARAEWTAAERAATDATDACKRNEFLAATPAWREAADRYAAARRAAQIALQWTYDEKNSEGRRLCADRRFTAAADAWKAAKAAGAMLDEKPEDLPLMDQRLANCDLGLRVPDGFRPAAGAVADKGSGWADRIVHVRTGIELVHIPIGSFIMGQQEPDETPAEVVNITRPFYLGRYEVTQGEWRRTMRQNPSRHTGSDRLPVDSVSWVACQEFVKAAGDGLRLPTEAEWEYACRAWTQTPFNVGETLHRSQADFAPAKPKGWFAKEPETTATVPVGGYAPNAWGLYDMHGNVAEWCQDWYDRDAYRNRVRIDDPQGPERGSMRVLRGGSFKDTESGCRSARRASAEPSESPDTAGFRVAVTCP